MKPIAVKEQLHRQCRLFLAVLIFFWGGSTAHGGTQQEAGRPDFPPLESYVRFDSRLDFCGEPVPLSDQEIRERFEKEMLLILWDRPQVILWLKRANRYMPIIEEALAAAGMPDDLKYIAVIESSLLPEIISSQNAAGIWQFMKSTGGKYGLTINADKDERRNIYASTRAAIRYLKDLHGKFGSWTLAAAAYNMGDDRLKEMMTNQDVDTYYQLYLSKETMRYMPRILAAKLIFNNQAQYGFHMQPADLYPPLEFDRLLLTCKKRIPLRLIARAAGTYYYRIKELNPDILGSTLDRGSHMIALPKGSTPRFNSSYQKLLDASQAENRQVTYVVRTGDSLGGIAERFKVTVSALEKWNKLQPGKPIHPGDQLLILE